MEQKMILRTIDVLSIVFLMVGIASFLSTFPLGSDSGIFLYRPAGIISFLIILLSLYGLMKLKTKTYYFITYIIFFKLSPDREFFKRTRRLRSIIIDEILQNFLSVV